MKARVSIHRVGNHSVWQAAAHPTPAPLAPPAAVQDGWFCTRCFCVMRERVAHAGCSATPEQMCAHVRSEPSTTEP